MGSLANRHGRVIAENIAGNDTDFPGVLGAFLVKVFDLNVGAVGLSEQAARDAGLKPASLWGTFPDRPEYYPEAASFTIKMVYGEDDLKLLGLQVVGKGSIARRVDTYSAFLQHGATIDDLLDFEHGYAPPYSEALDPLHHMAAMAIARQKGTEFVPPAWSELNTVPSDTLWLDVREDDEIEASPWSVTTGEIVRVPLDDLRSRIGELDRERRIMIVCRRGPRSYQASLILKQAGFKDVAVVAGGTSAAVPTGTQG